MSVIFSPLAAILDFAGGVALQAVSECPLCRWASILMIGYQIILYGREGVILWVLQLKGLA